ncbi:hypothetical protein FCM35_KLT07831 [Carex littledalei]|uniref:Uncharacterized protein n=1 Tax=Carex littledalei TaxID=544730 RepID=A0A833QZQ6_9POAL|nr:hypothetical protein FCM35_KLT07831 [Carex littledalei]
MQPETTFSDITIHLRRDSAIHLGSSPLSTSAITVPLPTGVDLGLVGRVLGLDPSTVRLNGYYVSRSGPRYVSRGILWGQLLDFFAQRGLPCGGGVGDAIVVQGKHMGSTDGNPFLKRKFHSETECPFKKRKAEINCKPNKSVTLSIKRSLEFQLETESPRKKRKLEANYNPKENGSTKRSLNSDDASVTFKKVKTAESNTGTQKSHTATTSHVPIYLRLDSSVGFCGASPPNCTITISLSSYVDLGLVGRMLGLDPNTMCLNGYYVSHIGPCYVLPGLSWGPMLDFFAQRRLPCGSEIQDAIVVQGKYMGPTVENLFLKRKVGLGTECLLKKRKVTNYKSNESVVHHIKRIINSDDIQDSFKRTKKADSSTSAQKSHTSMHVSHASNLAIMAI